jgi:hypothetical protein
MIVWDDQNKHMVDDENGDYLEMRLRDREEHEYSVALCASNGTAYFAGCTINESVKEFDTPAGGATVVRWILKEAWITAGHPELPFGSDVPDHLVRRLELFLKSQLERQTWLRFMPRFEFIDARNVR